MRIRALIAGAIAFCTYVIPQAGWAQNGANPPERIEIGLSTEEIAINSNFSGETLTIFGAADNTDPLVLRQGRYDIFVILEGPRINLVTRRKGRVFGIWMNVEAQPFANVPLSYLIASTRLARDITDQDAIARLALTTATVPLRADVNESAESIEVSEDETSPMHSDFDAFAEELRRLKIKDGLYKSFPRKVQFVSQSLFRAELRLPANVPLGNHTVKAYLFKNGSLVAQTRAPLSIAKAGLEITIFRFANEQSLLYGLIAVIIALIIGWLGRVVFKKD